MIISTTGIQKLTSNPSFYVDKQADHKILKTLKSYRGNGN